MTNEELSEIEARANAATPGPWKFFGDGSGLGSWATPQVVTQQDGTLAQMTHYGLMREDAEFIAHARFDIPRLIDEIRMQRIMIKEMAERIKELESRI